MHKDANALRYEWRTDRKELAAYVGGFIVGIDLLEQVKPSVLLRGMSIQTDRGELAIVNAGATTEAAITLNPRGIPGGGYKRIIAI